ncbi:enoyl-CoA hydratase [Myxococcota bacterium]|nr:enoyl-CoA hydratase [Myxococcota bacterium]
MTNLDTGTDQLLATLSDGIVTLTFNRPEVRNALGDIVSPALRRMIEKISIDPEVRCVVITGAGTTFCAGGDVKGMGDQDPERSRPASADEAVSDLIEKQMTLTGALYAMPKPTLASLPGAAAGAGLSIALACDLRIAAQSAFITTGFSRIGLSGDYGCSFFLTQIVGTARARELFFTSERIGARQCEEWGLINRVVPDDQLVKTTRNLALQIASGPPVAYAQMKKNLDHALRSDLASCLKQEARGLVQTAQTSDHREAVKAFVEKRNPEFKGH